MPASISGLAKLRTMADSAQTYADSTGYGTFEHGYALGVLDTLRFVAGDRKATALLASVLGEGRDWHDA